jgi:UDP-N-acetylglucosamine 2-epimerase (non-hydrolysing)
VSAHREENVDPPESLAELLETLDGLVEAYGQPVVVSTHPRTRQRLSALESKEGRSPRPLVRFLRPFGFFDYIALQKSARCVLSDSGTITEESSLLGFPAVTIREAHERPEGMDEAVVVMCGLRRERVLQAVDLVLAQHAEGAVPRPVPDYDGENVSRKVVRIILSYVDYVNRTVWQRRL